MPENILKRIEAENEESPLWIVGPKTGKMLHRLVLLWEPENILEIGTSVAYSTLWMASALEKVGKGTLYTIESHKERFRRAQTNVEESGLGHRVRLFRAHAPEVLQDPGHFGIGEDELPQQIDFAFFDATKKDHARFFEVVHPRLNPGGLICVDNVHSHRFGEMQKFIESLQGNQEFKVVELRVGAGLLLAVKKA